jgi:TP901-1 family phage major tail protein
MTAKAGRAVVLAVVIPPATEATRIAGLQTKSVSLSAEGIDITNDDDSGYRTLLADTASVKTLDIECGGVAKDGVLPAWLTAGTHRECIFTYPLEGSQTVPRTITGNFRLTKYSEDMPTDGEVKFKASLQSTGTFTDAAGS